MSDWKRYRDARPATDVLHLDSASAGRLSAEVIAAVATHLRHEAEVGAYTAEAEAAAVLDALWDDLAGLLGVAADGLALVESTTAGLLALLRCWPLPRTARVGVAPAEWGPNLVVLREHGHEPVLLDVDGDGVLDLDALDQRLSAETLDLLLVDAVSAHRGLVQPSEDVVAVARRHGVPVWLDAAQALGHVALPADAPDAVVAPARKWLAGGRGVGVLGIRAEWHERLRLPHERAPETPRGRLTTSDAHVAGRVGLAAAVREHLALGPGAVHARLAEVGERVRTAVDALDGWDVVRPGAPAASITAIRPTQGQDAAAERERLWRDHRVLTTLCLPWRAPHEVADGEAWLRVSAHVDLADDDLERLVRALHRRPGAS